MDWKHTWGQIMLRESEERGCFRAASGFNK